jgi:replicative DNA helicase
MSEQTENTFTAYLGPEFQQRLMWQLLVEPEFAEKTIPELSVEYFDDPNLKRLFLIILEHIKEYEKVPNLQNQSILQAVNQFKTPNNVIEEESLFSVIERIKSWNERVLNMQLQHDGDVVQRATNNFIKQQEYRKIAENIITKCKNGEMKNKRSVVEIEEKFQKVALIGNTEDNGKDVTEGLERALRKEFRQTIPTGVKVIDTLTGGGLGKGEFGLILTPSGVGKTTLLTKIANTAREDNKNVLQIIFEDTVEQIQRKHVTLWTKIPLTQLDEMNEVALKQSNEHIAAMGVGKLTIKKFSQEDTTMKDIRSWIVSEQKRGGFKYDIVILDYLDCLESHKKSPDRNEAELVIVKSFEAMASDFDIPCWSAIQSNRGGFDAELVEAHQTGGSIKRLQKSHFFMSVAKTPDQKEASLASIKIIKARFAPDGQIFRDCIFNNDTMEIVIRDSKYVGDGTKKYGEEEIRKFNEKKTAIDHAIISNAGEKAILADLQNKYIEQIKTEAISGDTITKINTVEDSDIVKQLTNTELIEIEDIPIVNAIENDGVTEGVNEGINEGVQPFPSIAKKIYGTNIEKEKFEWTGETINVGTNEIEVKHEDIKPEIVKTEAEFVGKSEEIKPLIVANTENFRNISEIEKKLIDPDEVPSKQKHVYDMLREISKSQ